MKQGFLMGTATAAHQVEGNNVNSDCWILENLPHSMYKEKSGEGVDHYHHYREDLDMLKAAGLNAYRFTIEWARIEPVEGAYDEVALQHYKDVLLACKERGIQPIVTLHHFSSPAWLIKKGGWKNEFVVEAFSRYCSKVVSYYGEALNYICTINEANMGMQIKKISDEYMQNATKGENTESEETANVQVGLNNDATMQFMMMGMQEASEAFGCAEVNTFLDGRDKEQEKIVMQAHQAARRAIKEINPDAKVGLTLSLFDIQALPGGEKLAEKLWYEDFGFYFPYMQDDDFIGVQNYTRKVVGPDGEVTMSEDALLTDAGYEFYPKAIGNVVSRIAALWDKEILITENGISTMDDSLRCIFIRIAMEGIRTCLEHGVKLVGYCHWSLLDNFEWQLGYSQKFGLIEVDRSTMERKEKPSLHLLGEEYRNLC